MVSVNKNWEQHRIHTYLVQYSQNVIFLNFAHWPCPKNQSAVFSILLMCIYCLILWIY